MIRKLLALLTVCLMPAGCRCDGTDVGTGSRLAVAPSAAVAPDLADLPVAASDGRNCNDPKSGCAGIPVKGVRDGDSLRVELYGRATIVRLAGVDAPERRQPFGREAEDFVAKLVNGRSVSWRDEGNDKFGRNIGFVFIDDDDGPSLNHRLVAAGLAWHYAEFSKDPELARLESEARAAKRGLWVDEAPVPPWEYRRRRGEGEAVPEAPPVEITDDVVIVGNMKSRKYHFRHCPDFMKVGAHNRVVFESAAAAEAAGYVLSGSCRP